MSLLTFFSRGAHPRAIRVLPDGVTVRAVFRGPLTAAAAATGWSFIVGGSPATVSAAVIHGTYIDFTLSAPVVLGATVTATFDDASSDLSVGGSYVRPFTAHPVRNGSWSGGALWTPASHGTNLDYGIDSDLTRLFKTNAFTTPVTAPGDPVVRWRGQRNVLHFTQGTAANQPSYQAGGVLFDTLGGVSKAMAATSARNHDAPTYCILFQTVTDRAGAGGGAGLHTFAPGGARTGIVMIYNFANFYAVGKNRYTYTEQNANGATVVGSSWDGTSLTFFDNAGAAVVAGADSSVINPISFILGTLSAVTVGMKSYTHAWVVGNGVITPDDYKKHAWWARYAS